VPGLLELLPGLLADGGGNIEQCLSGKKRPEQASGKNKERKDTESITSINGIQNQKLEKMALQERGEIARGILLEKNVNDKRGITKQKISPLQG